MRATKPRFQTIKSIEDTPKLHEDFDCHTLAQNITQPSLKFSERLLKEDFRLPTSEECCAEDDLDVWDESMADVRIQTCECESSRDVSH